MAMPDNIAKTVLTGIFVAVAGTVIATLVMRRLNLQEKQPIMVVPRFAGQVNTGQDCNALEAFISSNRGKLVEINADVATSLSKLYSFKDSQELSLGSFVDENGALIYGDCSDDVHIHVQGNTGHLFFYNTGHNRFSGYFAIDPNIEMHQGFNYSLRSVPPEEVLLRTQLGYPARAMP